MKKLNNINKLLKKKLKSYRKHDKILKSTNINLSFEISLFIFFVNEAKNFIRASKQLSASKNNTTRVIIKN